MHSIAPFKAYHELFVESHKFVTNFSYPTGNPSRYLESQKLSTIGYYAVLLVWYVQLFW